MSKLPGSTKLFDVLLPGTHDTMAWESRNPLANTPLVEPTWKTQSSTIQEQLSNGIRQFDLRVQDFGDNTYYLYHGAVALGTNYKSFDLIEDCLRPIEEFLEKNTGETIIISIKPEHLPDNYIENDSDFTADLLEKRLTGDKYFTTPAHFKQAGIENPEYKDLLTTQNPKATNTPLDYNLPLELLRGKILVIFRDDPFSNPEATKELSQ